VVVAVGLTLVVPLAAVEVNVPGVIAKVAPVVAQLSVLLPPELIDAGLAENELIVGVVPLPEPLPDADDPPQPARQAQMSSPGNAGPKLTPAHKIKLRLSLRDAPAVFMASPVECSRPAQSNSRRKKGDTSTLVFLYLDYNSELRLRRSL
jgi:hypothetical protein